MSASVSNGSPGGHSGGFLVQLQEMDTRLSELAESMNELNICNCRKCQLVRDMEVIADGHDDSFCFRDLYTSPIFLAEQQKILKDFEKPKPAIIGNETNQNNPSKIHQGHRPSKDRSRRRSSGIRISCPICLDSLSSTNSISKMVTECGHLFCQKCIQDVCDTASAVKRTALCPICRKKVGKLRQLFV